VEKPKRAMLLPIPSMIWLQPLNLCPVLSLEIPTSTSRLPISGGTTPTRSCGRVSAIRTETEEREAHPKAFTDIELSGVLQMGQLARKQVQGGTEVMDNFSDDRRPIPWQSFIVRSDSEHSILGVTVTLGYNGSIGLTLKRGHDVTLKSFYLFPCPADLSNATIQFGHACKSNVLPAKQSRTSNNAE
jgi:hypothetical protein